MRRCTTFREAFFATLFVVGVLMGVALTECPAKSADLPLKYTGFSEYSGEDTLPAAQFELNGVNPDPKVVEAASIPQARYNDDGTVDIGITYVAPATGVCAVFGIEDAVPSINTSTDDLRAYGNFHVHQGDTHQAIGALYSSDDVDGKQHSFVVFMVCMPEDASHATKEEFEKSAIFSKRYVIDVRPEKD